MKLLIVDDELWSRRLIRNLLVWREYGIDSIYEASNGKEAMDLLKKYQCDLMITDMRMPGMDGAMLLEQIYQQGINIEIIAMSGYEDYKYLHAALKTKAIDYLLKPVVKEELHTAVLTGINRINKDKSFSYMENILRRDDVKDELNKYHDIKIKLLHAVHQIDEPRIISTSKELYTDFFQKPTNPSLVSFILTDIKRSIMEIEQEYELTMMYHNDILPEDIEDVMITISNTLKEKRTDNQISVLDVQKYVSSHVGEPLSLASLATTFYVSKEHLSRIFKKEVGMSVQQYITSKKIEQAKTLLRNYNVIAISTIAYMCGYKDLQYFYRVFRKQTGMTPLHYREQYQNNPTNTSI